MFRPSDVVRLGTLSKRQYYWRVTDYFTNENSILGHTTFFNQTDYRWHSSLSGDGPVEIVSANGTNKITK